MLTKVVATQLRIFANPTKVYKDLQELAWKKGKLAKIYSVCSYCKAVYGEKYSSNLEDDGMLSHGACKPCFIQGMRDMDFSEEQIAETLKENPYANKD